MSRTGSVKTRPPDPQGVLGFMPRPIRPAARNTDPNSSREAAAELKVSGRLDTHAMNVLCAVRQHNGCTSAELGKITRGDRVEFARRLPDLAKLKYVRQGKARKDGICRVACVTWWITDLGRDALQAAVEHAERGVT